MQLSVYMIVGRMLKVWRNCEEWQVLLQEELIEKGLVEKALTLFDIC